MNTNLQATCKIIKKTAEEIAETFNQLSIKFNRGKFPHCRLNYFITLKKMQHQIQQAADKWKEKAQKDNQHV